MAQVKSTDYPLYSSYPIGGWTISGGQSTSDMDAQVLSSSGINILIDNWNGNSSQVAYWLSQSLTNPFSFRLNIQWPARDRSHYTSGFYQGLYYTLPEHYPVQCDEDSLALWFTLENILMDTMQANYINYPVYSSFCTMYDGLTQQNRRKIWPGLRAICDDAKQYIVGGRTFGYGYSDSLVTHLQGSLSILTGIPFSKHFVDTIRPENNGYNDWLQVDCQMNLSTLDLLKFNDLS
jgi:hypothetical protein